MSGFSFIPMDSGGHVATPRKDSWVTERGGISADLLRSEDYLIVAACATCGRRIRLNHKLQMEWRHAPDAPAGGAA
jgi:hypothetical protein